MNHISYEEWLQYAKDEINEQAREVYDNHLYTCDQCLELYLEAVAEYEGELPVLANPDEFTNLIMEQVQESKGTKKSDRPIPFYQKTFFHYAVAAAMTLIFMTSGVFQSITKYVDNVQSPHIEEVKPSITEELMTKTFAWIDSFEMKNREGN